MPFMQLTATLTLQFRATIDYLSFRDSVWNDPPLASFSAPLDLEASNIAWNIYGAGTDEGGTQYQYSGSGLRSLSSESDSGRMYSSDGLTVSFQVCCDGLSYTLTLKTPDGSSSFEQSTNMCATIWEGIIMGDDWSVPAGSYQDPVFEVKLEWNTFAPDPPFDMNGEPR